MAKKDVDVRFNLIDNFTSSFNKTIGTLTAGTKKAQNAWKSVEKVGEGITGVGTKMTAAVTAPLVGLGVASASEFGEVDKSLKLVQQTMGSTDAEAKVLEGSIKSAASNSVYGMQDAADAALNYARQGFKAADDDDKIRLNQRKPSKYKGLSRFGPEKNLQRINKFMKERPIFYKNLIQMKENFRFYLRCFYCITKVVILQFNSEKQDRISS